MITRSSWLNCALRDDEAVYLVSRGHYEAVAVGNWWYWFSRGHLCLYILHKVEIWKGVTHPDGLTTLKDSATQLLIKYKSGALVTQLDFMIFLLPKSLGNSAQADLTTTGQQDLNFFREDYNVHKESPLIHTPFLLVPAVVIILVSAMCIIGIIITT